MPAKVFSGKQQPVTLRTSVIDLLRGVTGRHRWKVVGTLVSGMLLVVFIALYIKRDAEASAQREFDFTCNEIRLNIEARLNACAQILHAGAGLFDASESVEREEWRAFTKGLQFEEQLPGIQGVGFALLVPSAQLTQHVQAVRHEGFPEYQIRPAGERAVYSTIVYLEPFAARNLRAFGYDMLSEPVRRAAMERARDENRPALSGKVILVQETSQDVQAGTLMYHPVYRHEMPIETVDQRRAAIQGWVYSPYRMTDLMRGTLRGWDHQPSKRQVDLEVYDGPTVAPKALLYQSQPMGEAPQAGVTPVTRLIPIDFAGRYWTLRFTQIGGLAALADYSSAWLILFGGTSIGLLMFGLTFAVFSTRAKAQLLQASEERFRTIFNGIDAGLLVSKSDTAEIVFGNPAAHEMLKYTPEELRTLQVQNLHPPGELPVVRAAYDKLVRQEIKTALDVPIQRKDGAVFYADISVHPIELAGKPYVVGVLRDVTERRQAEAELRRTTRETALLLQSVGDGVYGLDARGNTTFVNPVAANLLGYTTAELIGKPQHDLIHHHHPDGTPYDRADCPIYAAFMDGQVHHIDDEMFWRKDGSSFWVEYDSTPIRGDAGELIGAVVVFRDITARRQAEAELLEAKEQAQQKTAFLRSIMESPQGVIIFALDCDYRYTEFTPLHQATMKSIWGREIEIGLNMLEVISNPVDWEKAKANFDYVLQGQSLVVTEEYGDRSRERSFYENRYSPIYDKQGAVVGLTVFVVDISDRKRAEAELRLQGEALRAAANTIVITDQTGNIVWANPAFTALTGYELSEVLGKNHRILKSGQQDATFYRQLWETINAGQIWSGKLVNKRKDGSLYTEELTITPIRSESGAITHFIAIKQDITAQQQAGEALRVSEAKFRKLFTEMSTGCTLHELICDAAGQPVDYVTLEVNPAFEQMAKFQRKDVVGKRASAILSPAELSKWLGIFGAVVRTGKSANFEMYSEVNQKTFVGSAFCPEPGKFAGTFIDVTELKRTEQQLQSNNVQLNNTLAELRQTQHQIVQQAQLRGLGQMASGVAHDFNNALSPIAGFSEILLKNPAKLADRERTVHWLTIINTCANDATKVVRRLSEFARQRAQRDELLPVDLNAMVRQTVELTQPRWKDQTQATGRTIQVATDLQAIPVIVGEDFALREMLTNLIFNAVDALPVGGQITIGTAAEGGWVRLWIQDTGTGMTEEVRQRCFEPFFTTKNEQGNGLGLAMVHGIVQRHGGTAAVASQPGLGTTFTFRFPIPAAPTVATAATEVPPLTRSIHVLVVDDEPALCALVEAYLTTDGHTVVTAPNGAVALTLVKDGSFDLVLTDKAMPNLNGEQLAAAIYQSGISLPVILMTGFGDMMQAAGNQPQHIEAILSKPITEATLRTALAKVFPQNTVGQS